MHLLQYLFSTKTTFKVITFSTSIYRHFALAVQKKSLDWNSISFLSDSKLGLIWFNFLIAESWASARQNRMKMREICLIGKSEPSIANQAIWCLNLAVEEWKMVFYATRRVKIDNIAAGKPRQPHFKCFHRPNSVCIWKTPTAMMNRKWFSSFRP